VKQAKDLVRQYESTERDRVFASLEKKKVAAHDRQAHEEAAQILAQERAHVDDPAFNVARVLENSPESLLNLWRHESSLTRSLLRCLHELERLKAKRAGLHVPVPEVVEVDLNVSAPSRSDIEGTNLSEETD
jgi:hypothetical protein